MLDEDDCRGLQPSMGKDCNFQSLMAMIGVGKKMTAEGRMKTNWSKLILGVMFFERRVKVRFQYELKFKRVGYRITE